MKPVILLTPKFADDPDNFGAGPFYRLKDSYPRAITQAGGISLIGADGDPEEYARIADGILFTGGADLDPDLYKQPVVANNVIFDRMLDDMELALYHAFVGAGKPVFGICRGIQTINVAAGGTLWQDLPTQIKTLSDHRKDRLIAGKAHWIQTKQGSLINRLFGDFLFTNSYHHQAVRDLAPGFRQTAWSDDGIIEAIEHESLPIFAVQWHPERMLALAPDAGSHGDDPPLMDMMPLFSHFVRLCQSGQT